MERNNIIDDRNGTRQKEQNNIIDNSESKATLLTMCIKTTFGSSLPQVVCGKACVLFKLFMLFFPPHSGVQHILFCVFVCFLRLVYLILSVSLDCPFLIASSMFSNVYSQQRNISNIIDNRKSIASERKNRSTLKTIEKKYNRRKTTLSTQDKEDKRET